jgi:formylglycine-generating enzyme required for sulfatase activity
MLAAAPGLGGEKYALVVGVNEYLPTELPSLSFAEADAEALSAALRDLGFSVLTMTSKSPIAFRPTTADKILEQAQRRLEDRDPGDTVILALSGHGVQFTGEAESFFCPGEARLRRRESLVPMGRLLAEIGNCKAGRKLLLVDACREELTPEAAGKSGVVIELEPAMPFREKPPAGTVAILSCRAREKSYELPKLGHSVFTHHIVEYLRGKAPADRYPARGEVSVSEMASWVRSRTRDYVDVELAQRQTPDVITPEGSLADWPLGRLGEEPKESAGGLASVDRKLGMPSSPGQQPAAEAKKPVVPKNSPSSRPRSSGTLVVPSLPEGSPQQLLDFIANLKETNVKPSSRDEMIAYMRDIAAVSLEAADKILGQVKPADPLHDAAAKMKLESLLILGRLGDEKAAAEMKAYAESQANSPSPELAKMARRLALFGEAQQILANGDTKAAELIVEKMAALLAADPDDMTTADMAMQFYAALEQMPGSSFVTASASQRFIPILAKSSSDQVRSLGGRMQPVIQNSLGMKLARISDGEFEMGSEEYDDERPIHRVRITKPFLMGQTEVTQSQFERVMGTTPWRGKDWVKDGATVAASYVSWDDATEFCRRLTETERRAGRLPAGKSYRLPTEAEWEYACRAGTKTKWSFGDDEGRLGDHAWWGGHFFGGHFGNGNAQTERYAHEVGQKKPNPWGLFDMHGNAWEWCSDWYAEDYYGHSPATDPKGPSSAGSFRVFRGGSWFNNPFNCRSADRGDDTPTKGNHTIGFRVVCELE